MDNNQYYFYVLECSDGSYYAGYTNDVTRRVKMHNQGKGAKYTRGRTPVSIVYKKDFSTKSEALKAEYQFKQLDRKEKEQVVKKEPSASDVAAEEFSK